MLALKPVLVLNLTLDQIVKRQDIPSVVRLRLDLPIGARLQTRLCVVQPVLLVQGHVALRAVPLLVAAVVVA